VEAGALLVKSTAFGTSQLLDISQLTPTISVELPPFLNGIIYKSYCFLYKTSGASIDH
jgi:hypothetical protein